MGLTKKVARYYRGARTAHLERLHRSVPGDFFYQKSMYDFDKTQAPATVRCEQVSLTRIVKFVLWAEYSAVEIVEPYALSALPQNLVIGLSARLGRLLHREPTQLFTYAIENADLPAKVASNYHLPVGITRWLLRLSVGFAYGSLSRVVFGTEDARRNYAVLLAPARRARSPKETMILGLPEKREDVRNAPVGPALDVLFLGAFDERKGLMQLLESWPQIAALAPAANLHVAGKGALEEEIVRLAGTLTRVSVSVDPPREEVWELYRRSDVLVLLSQPSANWKEQIGLPIVEGLSFGLEIVASSETGLADWLRDHGHRVLAPSASPGELAQAVVEALKGRRSTADIHGDLPSTDGRLAADAWLFSDLS